MSESLGPIDDQHQLATARFAATGKAMKRLDRFATGLASLTKLRDTITPEDVIKEAGKLVAGGEDPMELAGLLAEMPQNGGPQALAKWVSDASQQVAQNAAQVGQAHAAAGQTLGVASLHKLAAAHPLPAQGTA